MGRVRTREEISRNMAKIRSRDTGPELALRRALWARGMRYRVNYKPLPGTPDVAFTARRIAVFADGDFWHGRDWEKMKGKLEAGRNPGYWVGKIAKNMERDECVNAELEKMGWRVIRFWGSDILKNPDACAEEVMRVWRERG